MTGLVMFLHGVIAIFLIVVILMQSGRGGGLTEGFAGAESMFGARTNEVMIKATSVLAGFFLITCLGLAVISAQKGKSLMEGVQAPAATPVESTATSIPASSDQESLAEPVAQENEADELVPLEEIPKVKEPVSEKELPKPGI